MSSPGPDMPSALFSTQPRNLGACQGDTRPWLMHMQELLAGWLASWSSQMGVDRVRLKSLVTLKHEGNSVIEAFWVELISDMLIDTRNAAGNAGKRL